MRSGLVAEFTSAEEALVAARALRSLGYDKLEAYTPFPVPELMEPLGIRRTSIPLFALGAGATGGALAYAVIAWTTQVDYPLDVGGRPPSSLPADVPIVFETTVLFAALATFALVFLLSGLPKLHDPIMDVEGFERTSLDRFWIGIDDVESVYNRDLPERLRAMGAVALRTVGGEP